MTSKWGDEIKKKENKQTRVGKKSPQAISAGMVNRGKHVTLATLIMGIYWKGNCLQLIKKCFITGWDKGKKLWEKDMKKMTDEGLENEEVKYCGID